MRRALAAGATAVAVAACGGATPSALATWQRQAARECTRAQGKGEAIKPPAGAAQMAAFLRRGIAVLGPELDTLRALRVPPGHSRPYSSAVGALARELAILTDSAHDLDRGADPLTEIKVLEQRLAPVQATGDAAWRTLGVPACVAR